MPSESNPRQRLASLLLGEDLGDWVAERRRDPELRLSWRMIARQLRDATNGEIDVTGETLRLWYGAAEFAPTTGDAA